MKSKQSRKYSIDNRPTKARSKSKKSSTGLLRLNQYIAHAGICSRREADELIRNGKITVNGKQVTELGVKVMPSDRVVFKGKLLKPESNVYILLNKPRDFITTTNDPQERKTVMQLVENACPQRVYPVGRLDRNTSGLLLFTNDGALAEKLAHPSHQIRKIYQVGLDRPLNNEDLKKLDDGIDLEDGPAMVDDLAILTPDRKTLGIELHAGRNRIVRRIFEALGYQVERLDRVAYAGLTKKDLPRGKWRFLQPREVLLLKMEKK